MLRRIANVLALASLLLTSGSCHNSQASSVTYTVDAARAISRTAYVQFRPAFGDPHVMGSAWAVKDGRDYKLITAQHVALPFSDFPVPGVLEICSYKNDCVAVDIDAGVGPVIGAKTNQDWIYWEVDQLPKGMKPSRIDVPAVGEPVCVSGAPLGRVGEFTCGQVTNLYNGVMYIDARVLPGNSGGPVFDEDGNVLGMLVAVDYPADQGLPPVTNSGIVLLASELWL